MNAHDSKVDSDRELLREAVDRGFFATIGAYLRLSGPGWLQSAITLGGGSLGSSLYLGVLGGYGLLWVQPLAMILGIVMLSAIGYVTLSTGERPFRAINEHVNPVLGWGWALAVAAASWALAAPADGLVAWRTAATGPWAAWVHAGHGVLAVLAGILAWRLLRRSAEETQGPPNRGQEE